MSPEPVEIRKGVIALFAQDPEGVEVFAFAVTTTKYRGK